MALEAELFRKGSIPTSTQLPQKEMTHECKCDFIYHFDAPNGTARKLPGFKNFPTFWNVWGPGRWAHCIMGTPSPLGYGRWENRCVKRSNIKGQSQQLRNFRTAKTNVDVWKFRTNCFQLEKVSTYSDIILKCLQLQFILNVLFWLKHRNFKT